MLSEGWGLADKEAMEKEGSRDAQEEGRSRPPGFLPGFPLGALFVKAASHTGANLMDVKL